MSTREQQDAAINVGECLERLEVTDLTVDGQAVARSGARVVFLDRGLPGAVVDATVSRIAKNVVHAIVERQTASSPHEIVPWCPHFGECGGCTWQNFAPPAALEWKAAHVRQTLSRIGKLPEVPVSPVIASPAQRQFRNKMSYAFAEHDGGVRLGLRKAKEHRLVEVTECALQHPVGMDILKFVREAVCGLGLRALHAPPASTEAAKAMRNPAERGYLRFLVLHTPLLEGRDGKPQLLVECISGTAHKGFARAGMTNAEAVALLGQELVNTFGCTFVHSERGAPADVAQGEKTIFSIGGETYRERFGSLVVTVPYDTFLQTNTLAADRLYSLMEREAMLRQGDIVWDVYCGIGIAGLLLAGKAGGVHGFEIQKAAIKAARFNATALGYSHCSFHAGDVAMTLVNKNIPQPDVIIVDPPRAGLSEPVRDCLAQSQAQRLVYISCNVATQARDAAALSSRWSAVKSCPVDMFPYTPHVENLLVFERREE